MHRRRFVGSAAAVAAGLGLGRPAPASTVTPLPTVPFKDHRLTKLLIGSNPLYGYSHFNAILDQTMREWYTPDRRIEVLKTAEAAGINTWQTHYNEPTITDWKRYRAEGGKMNVLLLADFALLKDWSLLKETAKLGPIGIAHHGNRTDDRFRDGQMKVVHDFTKAVHDVGVPAGVSTHNPAVVKYIEEQGWDIDYYMTCLYRVSRTVEEARREFNEAPLGETFMEKDPERMTAVVRKTKRTCFAFKLLGAGRTINKPEWVENAFRCAIRNIKPQDAVIVGMFPKFKNEVQENVDLVRRITAEITT